MSERRWYPLRVRKSGRQADYDALVDGVPAWLRQSLVDWLNENVLLTRALATGVALPNREALRMLERHLRVALGWDFGEAGAHIDLVTRFKKDGDLLLDTVDFSLQYVSRVSGAADLIRGLDYILRSGGSAWMVAPDGQGLVERVVPEVVEAARRAIESEPRAGQLLGEAWRHVYGRDPDSTSGYREAVRAVEVAARPVVSPSDGTATLGKIIGTLPGERERFTTAFGADLGDFKPLDAVLGLMDLVWKYQRDRHGTDDETVPLHVAPEQAEAALHAAVTLVQWFHRGGVRRKEK